MNCPYCDKAMQKGILSGDGRSNVTWHSGNSKVSAFDRMLGIGKVTAAKHTLSSFFIEADYCEPCRKMIFDTDIEK